MNEAYKIKIAENQYVANMIWTQAIDITSAKAYKNNTDKLFKQYNSNYGICHQIIDGVYSIGLYPNYSDKNQKETVFSLGLSLMESVVNDKNIPTCFIDKLNQRGDVYFVLLYKGRVLFETVGDINESLDDLLFNLETITKTTNKKCILICPEQKLVNDFMPQYGAYFDDLKIQIIDLPLESLVNTNSTSKIINIEKLRYSDQAKRQIKKYVGLAVTLSLVSLTYYNLTSEPKVESLSAIELARQSAENNNQNTITNVIMNETPEQDFRMNLKKEVNYEQKLLTKLLTVNNSKVLYDFSDFLKKKNRISNGWQLDNTVMNFKPFVDLSDISNVTTIKQNYSKKDNESTVRDILSFNPDAVVKLGGEQAYILKIKKNMYSYSGEEFHSLVQKLSFSKIYDFITTVQLLKSNNIISSWTLNLNQLPKRNPTIDKKKIPDTVILNRGWISDMKRYEFTLTSRYLSSIEQIADTFSGTTNLTIKSINYNINSHTALISGYYYEI